MSNSAALPTSTHETHTMTSNWLPSASIETLRQRQDLLNKTRMFFNTRKYLEVETPILSRFATPDLHIDSITTNAGYLHTSPEYPMKRLLAAGSGPIYQICKVFRANETSSRHNPEFTLIEWYQPGWNDLQLASEVVDLIQYLGHNVPAIKISYRDIFTETTGVDPMTCPTETLQELCATKANRSCDDFSRNDCLDLIMSLIVEPAMDHQAITVVTDFPASQAALAIKVQHPDGFETAKRFEIYSGGLELANGYTELTDAKEQRERFEQENQQRTKRNLPIMPIDINLIAAMEKGLPESAGVALGFDRVMMLCTNNNNIHDVIAFPWIKA